MMYLVGHGLFLLYKLHLKSSSITAVSWLCPLGQPLEERINVSAVSTAPQVFFQPLGSHLTYPGFSKMCTQWNTARQQPFPSPRCLANPGIKSMSLTSHELEGRFFTKRATWYSYAIHEGSTFMTYWLPKPPAPNTITLGFQHMHLGRTQIFIIS